MIVITVTSLFVLCVCLLMCDRAAATEMLARTKRETQSCKDKFVILETHSACQPKSPEVVSAAVSESEKLQILQQHNAYRSNVTVPAANMLKMTWDDEIAMVAQAWAETCSFKHDDDTDRNIPGRLSAGQNIGEGYLSWNDCIKGWYDESKDFRFDDSTTSFEKVGHYTQLVWATSNKLGCGMANCGKNSFHVCNYAPAGNIGIINRPYKQGSKGCDDCLAHCTGGKLCDCGELTCENGGTLDPSTCSCTCQYPSFQVSANCKLDCSNVTESYKCAQFGVSACTKYSSTVPSECPTMCNVCPYGAFDYKEKGITVKGRNSGDALRPSMLVISCVITLLSQTSPFGSFLSI